MQLLEVIQVKATRSGDVGFIVLDIVQELRRLLDVTCRTDSSRATAHGANGSRATKRIGA